jgi:hypothetical protein
MDLAQLTRRVVESGTEYTIVRPGITLCLLYANPAMTIGPAIADILEEYIKFIPNNALQTYLSADGTWKKSTKRTFNSTLGKLRATGPGEYAEFHFGQEPLANVGKYGAHFKASPLDDDAVPLEDCILYLEFPATLSEFADVDAFIAFVNKIALLCDFDSGYCGYAFKHLHMTFRREAFKAIGKMAMRYIGFDICNDFIRDNARGRVCNLAWLTLFGNQITAQLGGVSEIRKHLPDIVNVLKVGSGVMIRANEAPIVGDVNRGAKDVIALRRLSEITRHLRVETDNLGPDDPDFAERWLGRFDT